MTHLDLAGGGGIHFCVE